MVIGGGAHVTGTNRNDLKMMTFKSCFRMLYHIWYSYGAIYSGWQSHQPESSGVALNKIHATHHMVAISLPWDRTARHCRVVRSGGIL